MELQNINKLEQATFGGRKELFRIGMALLFIVGIMLFISMRGIEGPGQIMLMIAAMIGGYMAMNIGANDVANNVGPAVGSKALTLTGAIIIAAVFEASGALLAGGDVVSTIKKGIIDPALIGDADTFIWLMLAALEEGLATCVQASLAEYPELVRAALGYPSEMRLIGGMALGYADSSAPVNGYRTPREAVDSFTRFFD
ncbi:MAG: hypothetical protein B0D90_00160 [Candidatus Sedimenticola endophacoides]|nr:MAG: hypothetical protein B0D90_00160 [Candidatus Sedimenticola endophacoides]